MSSRTSVASVGTPVPRADASDDHPDGRSRQGFALRDDTESLSPRTHGEGLTRSDPGTTVRAIPTNFVGITTTSLPHHAPLVSRSSLAAAYLVVALPLAAQQTPSPAADSVTAARDTGAVRTAGPAELQRVRVVDRATRRNGYSATSSRTLTRTDTPLRDTPQSATVVTHALIADQAMQSMADVVRYVPGITMAQGEGHRDAPTIRGNSSTADFFVDGVRDDAQYLRDLYNVERVEALKGSNAMIFGRGGGGGVHQSRHKRPAWRRSRSSRSRAARSITSAARSTLGTALGEHVAGAPRTAMYENSARLPRRARPRALRRQPHRHDPRRRAPWSAPGYEHFSDERNVDRGIPSFAGAPAPTPTSSTFFGDPTSSRSRARVDAARPSSIEHARPRRVAAQPHALRRATTSSTRTSTPARSTPTGTQVNLQRLQQRHRRAQPVQPDRPHRHARRPAALQHTLLAGAELSRQGTDNLRNTGYFGGGDGDVAARGARAAGERSRALPSATIRN